MYLIENDRLASDLIISAFEAQRLIFSFISIQFSVFNFSIND